MSFKKLTLTTDQAETLEAILKARHFDHMFYAERRSTPKLQKEMHLAEAATIQQILITLADA